RRRHSNTATAGGQNADTSGVPNLSLLCRHRVSHSSEPPPPIPARAIRRTTLNAIPLPKSWLRRTGRRMATLAERPFSRLPSPGARFCCGRARAASQALVGHKPLPPPPVLGYSPTALPGIAMNPRGRPTLYRPDYPDLARRLCVLGGTNEEL